VRAGEGALISLACTSVISQAIEKGIDILQAFLVQKTFPPRNQILSAILQFASVL
jgi:hypothetical protein